MSAMTVVPTAWQVSSETHPGVVYTVTAVPGGWACTCPDQRFRRPVDDDHECKHIVTVQAYRTLYRLSMGGAFPALSVADVRALAAASDALSRLTGQAHT